MTTSNIYAAPQADVSISNDQSVAQTKLISKLQNQSTPRLVILSTVTFGIYAAHYANKQTKQINSQITTDCKIPALLPTSLLFLSYTTVALSLPHLFGSNSLARFSQYSDITLLLSSILFLVWGFTARNRLNRLLSPEVRDPFWLHIIWTFLFPIYYFNYKVNSISRKLAKE